ncbi:heat stress transcription factor B-4-like [Hibiscus syriacus]|uniref:Heat stress transcription factor B-4-like n=1 Tax=Hibiscus syriacus TaxID=106335 RepID=A0A6A3BN95_HIBSY|nr:heat stress transcription factor B-4-like [Hibiscus syriacus]
MAFPQHQFQQHYQPQQQEQSKNFRNLYAIDGQVSPPLAYYNTPDLLDSSQHPPYVPPYGSDGGAELQWNNVVESKRKKLKEQDLLENNSQISSVDFFQARSVSTGLGLSLDNNNRMASSVDSRCCLSLAVTLILSCSCRMQRLIDCSKLRVTGYGKLY